MARKYGIRIVIEMHTPVGGVAKNNDMMMFYEPQYAEHFVEVWRKIASALKGDNTIFAYDLINEPVQSRPPVIDYLKLQYAAAKAIREIDPSKPLIVASDGWNNPATFKKLRPLPLKDILYSVHMYRPHEYTHQGIQIWKTYAREEPSSIRLENFQRRTLRASFRRSQILRKSTARKYF